MRSSQTNSTAHVNITPRLDAQVLAQNRVSHRARGVLGSVEGQKALADERMATQRRHLDDKLQLLEKLAASKNELYRQISMEAQVCAQNDIADRSQ